MCRNIGISSHKDMMKVETILKSFTHSKTCILHYLTIDFQQPFEGNYKCSCQKLEVPFLLLKIPFLVTTPDSVRNYLTEIKCECNVI